MSQLEQIRAELLHARTTIDSALLRLQSLTESVPEPRTEQHEEKPRPRFFGDTPTPTTTSDEQDP